MTSADGVRFRRLGRVEEVGQTAPSALRQRSAVVIGCGELGTAAASLLVRMGVGRIRVVDRDVVELGNLGDQCLYTEDDVGERRPKAEAAAERLSSIAGELLIEPCVADVGPDNVRMLVEGFDVVIDGVDNLETKYLINDAAVVTATPWVYAGCAGVNGSVLAILPGRTHCLRCIWPKAPPASRVQGCEPMGLLPTTAAMVAAVQVTEAIKILLGKDDELLGQVATIDTWMARVRRIPSRHSTRRRMTAGPLPDRHDGHGVPAVLAAGDDAEGLTCPRPAKQVEDHGTALARRTAGDDRLEGRGELLRQALPAERLPGGDQHAAR